ncbi:TIGR02147 family protein [Peredibacter sp. HCB2-198]|uniref:TIGR02147 family protein n=1 Tax=Peredibacter sp. HCB2-198 TaxID=3383025 RepID=UPI0038B4BC3C
METATPYYILKIKDELSKIQRRSPRYSMRAYARDLGVHPATLSLVLKGKRPMPVRDSVVIAEKMQLGPKERTLFFESLYKTRTRLDAIQIPTHDEALMIDGESYFNVIAEWEHYAVLTLFDLSHFEPTLSEISRMFKISELRADVVINNLLQCGLLRHGENGLEKAQCRVRTTEDVMNVALQKSHIEAMEMGIEKIKSVKNEFRDFSTVTIAVNPEKLTEAKTIIREFRLKMAALLEEGHRSEVYQLAIQLYPLTENTKN